MSFLARVSCNPTDHSPPSSSVHKVLRQEYWSGCPFVGLPLPSARVLPSPRIEVTSLASPALTGRFSTTRTAWEVGPEMSSWVWRGSPPNKHVSPGLGEGCWSSQGPGSGGCRELARPWNSETLETSARSKPRYDVCASSEEPNATQTTLSLMSEGYRFSVSNLMVLFPPLLFLLFSFASLRISSDFFEPNDGEAENRAIFKHLLKYYSSWFLQ